MTLKNLFYIFLKKIKKVLDKLQIGRYNKRVLF